MEFIETFEHGGVTFAKDTDGNYWRLVGVKTYDCTKEECVINIKSEISALLLKLGLPQHLSGFEYLVEIINLIYEDPLHYSKLTTTAYPTIAKQFNTTHNCIERAIRHIIQKHSQKNELYYSILGESYESATNKQFLMAIVSYLRKK